MIRIVAFFSLVLFFKNSYSQSQFNIVDTTIMENYEEAVRKLKIVQDSFFFEDSSYVVRKTCIGEWGGSVWFKNKKTGIEYSCYATCPLVINKMDGKYYVTATLAHKMMSSKIIEINDPDSMEVFKMPKPRHKKGKRKFYYIGDSESNSRVGTNFLIDSFGVLTLISFVYENQLFHIVSDYYNTYLCKIENNQFVTLAKIADKRLPIYRSEILKTETGELIVKFNRNGINGFLEIKGNTITIKRYK
jgi:hypothetical protein